MDLTLATPKPLTLEAAVTRIRHAAIRHEPAVQGNYQDLPDSVNPVLRQALADRGIQRLYSHQAEAFQLIENEQNVVVVTPTASGKTLCYNLPVMNRLLATRSPRDVPFQPKRWPRINFMNCRRGRRDGRGHPRFHLRWRYAAGRPEGNPRARQHGADEPGHAAHRNSAPTHEWAKLFENLVSRHRRTALLSRRIRQPSGEPVAASEARLRVLRFQAQFICCSATIANPQELAEALTGPFRAGRAQWRAARREILRFLQSAGREPRTRESAAVICTRRGASRWNLSSATCRHWCSRITAWPPRSSLPI